MNKFLILLMAFLNVSVVSATNIEVPPPPPPTPFPGLPLDSNLVVLFGVALILGFYLIKKYNFTKKSSF
jgi:hypothetical protein